MNPETLYDCLYKHTAASEVNLSRLPTELEFPDGADGSSLVRLPVKNSDGTLRGEIIPRVHIVKYGAYMDEDETGNPDHEVDILARIGQGLQNQADPNAVAPKLHGFILEGLSPYGFGSRSQHAALEIATFSGMPVVRVGRANPGGLVPDRGDPLTING